MGRENARTLVTSVIIAAVFVAPMLAATGVVAGSSHAPTIESGEFVDDGVVSTSADNVTTMWNDGNYTLRLRVDAITDSYRVCSGTPEGSDADCRHVRFENGTNSVNVTAFPWADNATGSRNVTVSIKDSGTPEVHDSITRTVTLLDPDADMDSDGLANREERQRGTNMSLPDTDRDGIEDGAEVTNYDTDPLERDTDGDGLNDGAEIRGDTNATLPDTDNDGLDDGEEIDRYDTNATNPDTDGDGLEDGPEVNEYGTDPRDEDTDDDGYDDGREVHELGTDPNDATTLTESTEDDAGGVFPTAMGNSVYLLGFIAVLGVGIAIGLSVLRRQPIGQRLFGTGAGGSDDDVDGAPAIGPPRPPGGDDGPATVPKGDGTSSAGAAGSDVGPSPILTDEERVLRILHDHDGQVKQQRIVTDTDWSKSKVSRLLSRMADENKITKITLGRENVIRLPESETEPDGVTDAAGRRGN